MNFGKIMVIMTIFTVVMCMSWIFLSHNHTRHTREMIDSEFGEQLQDLSRLINNAEFTIDINY